MLNIVSWNINGLRAAAKKGLTGYMHETAADIYCFQEIKSFPGQLPADIVRIEPYHAYFHPALRKGYSGTAIYTRHQPRSVKIGLGRNYFDQEGRMLTLDFGDFLLYNGYYPNGSAREERLQYKLDFYDYFLEHIQQQLARGRGIILCGDFNTAHREIDLARPEENRTSSGFLPEERAWLDRLIGSGLHDSYRLFHQEGGNYTWWDMKTRSRERNIGWRIDYFFVSSGLLPHIQSADIHPEIMGSDHCPISLQADLMIE